MVMLTVMILAIIIIIVVVVVVMAIVPRQLAKLIIIANKKAKLHYLEVTSRTVKARSNVAGTSK